MIPLNHGAAVELDAELGQLRHLTPAERQIWQAIRAQRRGGERARIIPRELVEQLATELARLNDPPIGPAERALLARLA